jgi:hypothetical protein
LIYSPEHFTPLIESALKEIAKRLKGAVISNAYMYQSYNAFTESQTQKDREDEAAHCKKMKLDMVKMVEHSEWCF